MLDSAIALCALAAVVLAFHPTAATAAPFVHLLNGTYAGLHGATVSVRGSFQGGQGVHSFWLGVSQFGHSLRHEIGSGSGSAHRLQQLLRHHS